MVNTAQEVTQRPSLMSSAPTTPVPSTPAPSTPQTPVYVKPEDEAIARVQSMLADGPQLMKSVMMRLVREGFVGVTKDLLAQSFNVVGHTINSSPAVAVGGSHEPAEPQRAVVLSANLRLLDIMKEVQDHPERRELLGAMILEGESHVCDDDDDYDRMDT